MGRNLKNLTGNLGIVQILLKEVLQQLPEERAKEMVDAIEAGGEAALILRKNSRGRGYKTAFTVVPTKDRIIQFVFAKTAKVSPKAFAVDKGGEA